MFIRGAEPSLKLPLISVNLTHLVPLSFKREGEEIIERGLRPP